MEASSILCLIAVLSAFGALAFGIHGAIVGMRRSSVAERLQGGDDGRSTPLGKLLRNGVQVLMPCAKAAMAVPVIRGALEAGSSLLSDHGYRTTPPALCSLWLSCIALILVFGSLFGGSFAFGIIAAATVSLALQMACGHAVEKKAQKTCEQVPDALRSMGICFSAGLSTLQAFKQVGSDSLEPLSTHFRQTANELDSGATIDQALVSFRERSTVPELAFVAVALEVQHASGGSMGKILDAARDSVESDIRLKRSLRVQTAQAKLSAKVVTIMPFILVGVLSLVTEDFLGPFFASPAGFALLFLALGMQAAGILAVRNLLRIEVG